MRIHLDPSVATAVPGEALTLTLVIANDGETERTCRVRVLGLEEPWVEHSDAPLTVPADSQLELPIRITLPFGFPRGEQLVGVEVTPDGGRPLLTDAMLSVSDLESLHLGLSPVTVRGGWRGRFKLNLENKGTESLTIRLSGRGVGPDDSPSNLSFRFKPESITLRPGERAKTRGYVTGKRAPFGQPKRRALTVTAQGQTAPRHVQGAFIQRPMMPRNVLRVVGLVLVLAMWAGGLVTTVRMTSDRGDELAAGQDASSEGTAGEDGAGGEGGDGGDNGDGTQDEAVPTEGASIAGQVKGPTDPGGINVSLRPVALADDLSEEITLISTSAQEATKESSQTLRREPTSQAGDTISTVTDAEGHWAFAGLKSPANYEVTFAKAGFGERTYIVTVNDETPTVALEVAMMPGNGALSGRVSGPDGPMGGAVVTVTDGVVTFRTTTPTEGQVGTWSVDGLSTPGTWLVTVERRGFGTESTSVTLDSGQEKDGVDLTMVPGVGSIAGLIRGSGSPRGGITVTAVGAVTRTATTFTEDPVGRYALPQLPVPGVYTLTVTGDGWIPQTVAVDLTGNQTDVDLDLVPTTATIIGTVKDPTGKPMPSTGVTLAQDKPIVKTLSAIDPAGTYELTGLLPGTYTLTFDRADFKSESTIVTVAAGDPKTVDMTLSPLVGDKVPKDAVIRGIVRSASTGNAVTGVQVTMNGTVATTDATGSFLYEKLPPGSYDLTFTHESHQTTTRSLRIGAKSDTTIDVSMLTLGGIQGLVTDLTATPIAGVTVTVKDDAAANAAAELDATAINVSTTTDATGQFAILEKFKTGNYVATFTKNGYQERTRNFEVTAGSVVTGDIQLIELGAIHGTIQEPATGVTGGFVPLTGTGGDVTVTVNRIVGATTTLVQSFVDNDGEFLVTGLAPGDYEVRISKAGYATSVKELDDVKLRETRDGSVIMTPGAVTVGGRLTYNDLLGNAQPVVGATVRTTNAVTGFRTLTVFPFVQPVFTTFQSTTDSNGNWSILGPVAGSTSTYTMSATGFTSQTKTITATAVATGNDALLVAQPRDVQGTIVQNPVNADFSGVNVNVSGGTINRDDVPDAAGLFRFDDLPVGNYVMTITASGHKTVTSALNVPAGDEAVVVTAAGSPFTLVKYSSITVRVRDAGNVALENAQVTLNPGATLRSTSASGLTTFSLLDPNTYTVTVSLTGYQSVTMPAFVLAAGVDATNVTNAANFEVTLLRPPKITVTVRSGLSGSFSDVSGATVRIGPAGGATATAPTSIAGNVYTFDAVTAGALYDISVTATDNVTRLVEDVTAQPAGSDTPVAVDLARHPRLQVNLRSLFGATDNALTGVSDNIRVNGSPGITFSEGTGGHYTSDQTVGTGTYTLTIDPPGHTATSAVSIGVTAGTLTPGTTSTSTVTTNSLEVELRQLPTITVTVRSGLAGSFTDVGNATVRLGDFPGATATAPTSVAGNVYTFTGLTPGASYQVSVVAADNETGTYTNLLAVSGDDTPVAADLARRPFLQLKLRSLFGATNNALTGASSHISVNGAPGITFSEGAGGIYTSNQTVNADAVLTISPPGHTATSTVAIDVTAGSITPGTTSTATVTTDALEVELRQLPTITVTVRSGLAGSFTDVGNATVRLGDAGGTTATAPTSIAGNVYTFTGLTPAALYDISVTAADNETATHTNLLATSGQDTPVAADLARRPFLQLKLRSLFGATNNALTGASSHISVNGAPGITFSEGAGGVYTSNQTVNADAVLTISPPGHTATSTVAIDVTPGSITPGTTSTATVTTDALEVELRQLPTITVTVRSKRGGSLANINNATVRLGDAGGVTATAPNTIVGNVYTFTGLTPGALYDVHVTAPSNAEGTFPNLLAVSGQNTPVAADLGLQPYLQLRLRSLFDGTPSALTGAAGNIVVDEPGVTFAEGADGVYTSNQVVDDGTYTFTISPPGHTSTNTVTIDVTAGTVTPGTTSTSTVTADALEVQLAKLPSVTIDLKSRVTFNATPTVTDITDATGDTVVQAIRADDSVACTFTLQGANYVCASLAAGDYTITASSVGHVTRTKEGPFTIVAGVTEPTIEFILEAQPGSITGIVRDAFGAPLEGVTVVAHSGGVAYTPNATTDVNGSYTLSGAQVQAVTWTVTFQKATYTSLTQSITVRKGTAETLNGTLVQLVSTISGTVFGRATATTNVVDGVDNPATALNNVTVTVSGGGLATPKSQVLGATNAYSITDVPGGHTYTVTFNHTNYVQRQISVVVPVASVMVLSDTLTAHSGTVHIDVIDAETSAAVPGAEVRLAGVLLGATPTRDVTSVAVTGRSSFVSVPPGSYTVSLKTPAAGYLGSTATSTVTLGLSPGITATETLGSGTVQQDLSITKAVGMDVTVNGLIPGDTATVAVSWDTGNAPSQTATNHGQVREFRDLPPNKVLDISASAPNYTSGVFSQPALTLGTIATPTVTMVPNPGDIKVTVSGLLGADETTVILNGGTPSDPLANGESYTFTNVAAGVALNVTYGNANYSGTATIAQLAAGEDRVDGAGVALTLVPDDGALLVAVSGLVNNDVAQISVDWGSGSFGPTPTATTGLLTVPNVPAGVTATVTVTKADYTVPAPFTLTLNAGELDRAVPINVTPDDGSILVTIVGPGTIATETVTATATWAGGGGPVSNTGTGTDPITLAGIKPGVTVTVTATAPGHTGVALPLSLTLTAGQLNAAVTVTFTKD